MEYDISFLASNKARSTEPEIVEQGRVAEPEPVSEIQKSSDRGQSVNL